MRPANPFGALAKTQRMAKQKFRPTRRGGFSRAKAYISDVEVLKKTP
jgi:ribosomal protein L35